MSYSETYADYLAALETPALLLPYVLTTPAKINIVRRSDDESEEVAEYTWQFVTGQLLGSIEQITYEHGYFATLYCVTLMKESSSMKGASKIQGDQSGWLEPPIDLNL